MSNPYCTIAQLYDMYDLRAVANLSNDTNSTSPLVSRIQNILDMQAGEMESYLSGRVTLPLSIISPVLTKWVAVTTAARLYARRADKPKEIMSDEEWAKAWMDLFITGKVNLPGVDRSFAPALVDSNSKSGHSHFDYIFGGYPSINGPTGDGTPAT
jgi:phage gp36-like protein